MVSRILSVSEVGCLAPRGGKGGGAVGGGGWRAAPPPSHSNRRLLGRALSRGVPSLILTGPLMRFGCNNTRTTSRPCGPELITLYSTVTHADGWIMIAQRLFTPLVDKPKTVLFSWKTLVICATNDRNVHNTCVSGKTS